MAGLELILRNRPNRTLPPIAGSRVTGVAGPRSAGLTLRPRTSPRVLRFAPPPAQQAAPRSLWHQITDVMTNIPTGLAHLGKSAAITAVSPLRMTYDVARGDLSGQEAFGLVGAALMPWQQEEWANGQAGRYMPLTQELGTSMGQTALRARHPSRYLDAIKEGRILDVALEDVGNLALVSSGASKALTVGARGAEAAGLGARTAGEVAGSGVAGALETGARTLKNAAHLTAGVSDAPITALRVPGRVVKGLWNELDETGALRSTARRIGTEVHGGLAERLPLHFTDEGVVGRRLARVSTRSGQRMKNWTRRDFAKLARRLGIEADSPLVGAAVAIMNGVGDIDYAATRMGLDPEIVRQSHVYKDLPEHSYTPEIQDVTHRYYDGTLDPESRAVVDSVREAIGEKLDLVDKAVYGGEGRVKGALDEQYQGDAPIDRLVELEMQRADFSDELVNEIQGRRAAGMEWDEIAADFPELDEILSAPDVYPTAWRPSMSAALRLTGEGVEGLPLRPQAMLDAGMERPRYLPGGRSEAVLPRGRRDVRMEAMNEGFQPGIRMNATENRRVYNETQPYSLDVLADKIGATLRDVEFNKGLAKYAETAAVNRVSTILDPEELATMWETAKRRAEHERGSKGSINQRAREMYGQDVTDALEAQGYEIFAGNPDAPGMGDFDPGAPVRLADVTDDMVVLPANVKAALKTHWTNRDLNKVLSALRVTNSWWKGNVLPFSVRWQLGDMIGGSYMAWTGGGIGPIKMLRAFGKLDEMEAMRPGTRAQFERQVLDNPEFVDSGLNMQIIRDADAPRRPRTPIGRGIAAVRDKSFKFNENINAWNRHRYVLTKLYETLEKNGVDLDSLDASPETWARPQVQKAISEAVEDSNKVMGTFDELSPNEQRVIKNIIPFYVWQRHITQLAWHTAVDNPARMLWTLRLGSYGYQHQPDLPDFLRGSLVVPDALIPDFVMKGNGLLPLQWANPYNDVVGGSLIDNPLKSTAPLIKIAAAAGLGADLNSGSMQLTRPRGTGVVDSSGRDSYTPLFGLTPEGLSLRPSEIGYRLLQQLPFTREALNLLPTDQVRGVGLGPHPRYEQGTMMVDSNGNPIDETSRLIAFQRMFGIPGLAPQSLSDAEDIMSRDRSRRSAGSRHLRNTRVGLGG